MMKKYILYGIVAVVVLGGLGFFTGMKYTEGSSAIMASAIKNMSQSQRAQILQGTRGSGTGTGGGFVGGQDGTGMTAGGGVQGQVISKDNQSITLNTRNGSSKIVLYSSSTTITKPATGTANDIQSGVEVFVIGTQNPDGSITAQSLQIRPATPVRSPIQ